MSTRTSSGNVKITFWGGKGRNLDRHVDEVPNPETKRIKVDDEPASGIELSEPGEGRKVSAIEKDKSTEVISNYVNTFAPCIDSRSSDQRERLLHEPPVFNFSSWDHCDALQKKFKEERGLLFSWRTGWLDWTIETELIDNYSQWVHVLRKDGTRNMTPREESFYSGLMVNLWLDYCDLHGESRAPKYSYDYGAWHPKEMRIMKR